MNRKSSLIAWGFIVAILSAVALFTCAGICHAQSDLCSGFARQYADRYATPDHDDPNAFSGGVVCSPCGVAASNSNWSLLYNHAYESCARDAVVH